MFWSTENILDRHNIHPLIDPFDSARVSQGAYELSLGPEVLVTSQPDATKLQQIMAEREGAVKFAVREFAGWQPAHK